MRLAANASRRGGSRPFAHCSRNSDGDSRRTGLSGVEMTYRIRTFEFEARRGGKHPRPGPPSCSFTARPCVAPGPALARPAPSRLRFRPSGLWPVRKGRGCLTGRAELPASRPSSRLRGRLTLRCDQKLAFNDTPFCPERSIARPCNSSPLAALNLCAGARVAGRTPTTRMASKGLKVRDWRCSRCVANRKYACGDVDGMRTLDHLPLG